MQVYWYMYISQVSGERLQDHWSSGLKLQLYIFQCIEYEPQIISLIEQGIPPIDICTLVKACTGLYNNFSLSTNAHGTGYVPPTEGGGHIVFGADPVGICVGVRVLVASLNQWMDFDQTCTKALLGGSELITFW